MCALQHSAEIIQLTFVRPDLILLNWFDLITNENCFQVFRIRVHAHAMVRTVHTFLIGNQMVKYTFLWISSIINLPLL